MDKQVAKVEDEIIKSKLEIKKLELEQVKIDLEKKRNETNKKRSIYEAETRREHDKKIVQLMDEEEYLSYFYTREQNEKKQREEYEINRNYDADYY